MSKNVLKWIFSTVAFTLIDAVVWVGGFLLTRSLYVDARLYPMWSVTMLNALKNSVSWQSILLMLFAGLVSGLIYTAAYVLLKDKLSSVFVKRALQFSFVTFATGALYAFCGVAGMLYLPWTIVLSWIGISLVSSLATSFAIAALHRD